jgi:hypothetical protein
MRWEGHVAGMGAKRNAYRLLVGKPAGKRPLRRPRLRWVHSIRLDLGEMGWGDVDWIGLAQDENRWRAHVNSVLNLRGLQNAGKLSSGLTTGGLSTSAQLHIVSYVRLYSPCCITPPNHLMHSLKESCNVSQRTCVRQ